MGFKILVDSLIFCLADENTEISELSREILRDLIKNYKKFPEIIPKLSFINRQDLLYVIGRTDVLFRSTLNFSNYNSVRSHTIYRKTGLTVGSDRYKSEISEPTPGIFHKNESSTSLKTCTQNLSTQVPDNTVYKGIVDVKSKIVAKPNRSSKKCFGVVPTQLIKDLE